MIVPSSYSVERGLMRRVVAVLASLVLLSCTERPAVQPGVTGGFAIRFDASNAGSQVGSWAVRVVGPDGVPQNRSGAPGSQVVFRALEPGSYTVSVEGRGGNDIYFDQTVARISAGVSSDAIVNPTACVPAGLIASPQSILVGQSAQLRWSSLGCAEQYRVEWATNPSFSGASVRGTTGGTSLSVSPSVAGVSYYYRLIAQTPMGGFSRPVPFPNPILVRPSTFGLDVRGSGNGSGSVTSSPAGVSCSMTAGSRSGDCFESYATDTQVSLTATPQSGSSFAGWSGACGGTGACQIAMSQAWTVTASFTQSQRTLTVFKSGSGTVTSSPTGISIPTSGTSGFATFANGQSVRLTATPASGWQIGGWGGACSGSGTLSQCTVSMTSNRTASVTFVRPVPASVAINGSSSASVAAGESVEFSATAFDQFGNPISAPVEWWNYHQWTEGWTRIGAGGAYSQSATGHDLIFASVDTGSGRVFSPHVSVHVTNAEGRMPANSFFAPCQPLSWGNQNQPAGRVQYYRIDALPGRSYWAEATFIAAGAGTPGGEFALVAKSDSTPTLTDYDWISDGGLLSSEELNIEVLRRTTVVVAVIIKSDITGGGVYHRNRGGTLPSVYCQPPPTIAPAPAAVSSVAPGSMERSPQASSPAPRGGGSLPRRH